MGSRMSGGARRRAPRGHSSLESVRIISIDHRARTCARAPYAKTSIQPVASQPRWPGLVQHIISLSAGNAVQSRPFRAQRCASNTAHLHTIDVAYDYQIGRKSCDNIIASTAVGSSGDSLYGPQVCCTTVVPLFCVHSALAIRGSRNSCTNIILYCLVFFFFVFI